MTFAADLTAVAPEVSEVSEVSVGGDPGGVMEIAPGPHASGDPEPGWVPAEAVEWPTTEEGWLRCLADPKWRLRNLYRIADENGRELAFRPNEEQEDLLGALWYWNLILKARQLGFTTLLTILALDQCMFVANFTAAIVFHNLVDAEKAFRNKVKFAYERLPEALKARVRVRKETGTEIVFDNGSSLGVGVSARSGTIQWLHVSEFGKMCARFPEKAREVVTGSFNAVPKDGLIFIESTAEGQAGYFYDYCMEALKRRQEGLKAARGQFKLHFYPWWGKRSYVNDDPAIVIDVDSRKYFDRLQTERGIVLTLDQRRWYVAKAATQGEDMKREYPSYPEEAFEQAIVGAVYGKQMEFLRTNHRITSVPWEPSVPVHTFWDLGQNDATAIWFMQRVGMENRFIDYEEETGEGFAYFVNKLRARPYTYGLHHLPHDARVKRQAEKGPESPEMILKRLEVYNIKIVTRIHDVTTGIDLTRTKLQTAWIDKDKCAKGIKALDSYQFEWDEQRAMFTKVPLHNWASNGADALRQWAQGFMEGSAGGKGFQRHRGSWRA